MTRPVDSSPKAYVARSWSEASGSGGMGAFLGGVMTVVLTDLDPPVMPTTNRTNETTVSKDTMGWFRIRFIQARERAPLFPEWHPIFPRLRPSFRRLRLIPPKLRLIPARLRATLAKPGATLAISSATGAGLRATWGRCGVTFPSASATPARWSLWREKVRQSLPGPGWSFARWRGGRRHGQRGAGVLFSGCVFSLVLARAVFLYAWP